MFNFEGHDVRVVLRDGDPWFVLIDVCQGLDVHLRKNKVYPEVNLVNVKAMLNDDELTTCKIRGSFGDRLTTIISESGLYRLIMRAHSRSNPAAQRFQNWVSKEVLPSIRKDGMYVMGEEKVRSGEMSEDELVLKALTLLQGKVSRLSTELAEQKAIIDLDEFTGCQATGERGSRRRAQAAFWLSGWAKCPWGRGVAWEAPGVQIRCLCGQVWGGANLG